MRSVSSLRGLFHRKPADRGQSNVDTATGLEFDAELDADLRARGLTPEQLARIHSLDYLDDDEIKKALAEVKGARARWQEVVDRGDVPRLSDLQRRNDP